LPGAQSTTSGDERSPWTSVVAAIQQIVEAVSSSAVPSTG
jgi:hypothetical protein